MAVKTVKNVYAQMKSSQDLLIDFIYWPIVKWVATVCHF